MFPYCVRCKGSRNMCGLGRCPLLDRVRSRVPKIPAGGRTIEGPSPPSVFVGRFGYPRITIGPLAPPIHVPLPERMERVSYLFERTMEDIYSMRSSLIRGKYGVDIRMARDPRALGTEPLFEVEGQLSIRGRKMLSSVQELALSSRSLDTEMIATREIGGGSRSMSLDAVHMPMGPSLELERMRVIDNPRVPNAVERISGDTDLGATEGTVALYAEGISLEHLTRLFSMGLLGEGEKRRIVPTRWSITALDDTISKRIQSRLMDMEPLERCLLYKGNRFGNHFLIAFYPPPFRFEMLEKWHKGSIWGGGQVIHDHEGPLGRRSYASNITGAYYAARLSAAEHLKGIRRNGGATVIRWITEDYWAPLGVWVVRETVKRALQEPPEVFDDAKGLAERIDKLSTIGDWKRYTVDLGRMSHTRLEDFA